jgi:hypothetical protein
MIANPIAYGRVHSRFQFPRSLILHPLNYYTLFYDYTITRSILVINFYKYRIYIYDKITKNLENKFQYPTKWNIKSHLV